MVSLAAWRSGGLVNLLVKILNVAITGSLRCGMVRKVLVRIVSFDSCRTKYRALSVLPPLHGGMEAFLQPLSSPGVRPFRIFPVSYCPTCATHTPVIPSSPSLSSERV